MTIANRPDATELTRLYVEIGLTQTEIAARYGTYQNTVKHWLKAHNITKGGTPRTGGNDPKRVSWLEETEANATTLDCDTPEPATVATATGLRPSNAELRRLYVDEALGHAQIGQRYGVPTSTVKSWCRRAGLTGARQQARAALLAKAGPVVEKAKASPAAARPHASGVPSRGLRKIESLPAGVQEQVRAALQGFLAHARAKRLRREFEQHEEEDLL